MIFGMMLNNKCNSVENPVTPEMIKSIIIDLFDDHINVYKKSSNIGVVFTCGDNIYVHREQGDAAKFIDGHKFKHLFRRATINGLGPRATNKASLLSVMLSLTWDALPRLSVTDELVGMIDCSLSNERSLYTKHKEDFQEERGDNIILQLTQHHRNRFIPASTIDGIEGACGEVVGQYAGAFICKENPHVTWLFKRYRGTTIRQYTDKRVTMFSSSGCKVASIVDKSVDLGEYKDVVLDTSTCMAVNTATNEYHIFKLPRAGIKLVANDDY